MSNTFDCDDEQLDDDTPKIPIPHTENDGFSFGKLWAFTGPGFLLCVAYLDPGNIEADLQAGVVTKYKILWVLLGSTILGLMMQRLSLRLGVVTGRHLAEMCHLQYPTLPRLFLWLMIEVAIIGSDMQEVIGTAIALYLLSNKLIPLWMGVVITVVDTFLFLTLDRFGLRRLELFFAALVAIMVFTFGYEFVVARPSGFEMMKGLVVPWCKDCDSSVLLQAIGIIGSTIMPHNLYLHSGLVKSREVDRSKANKVREANMYFFFESFMGLTVSFTINALIVSVFASELYEHTNADVLKICMDSNVPHENIFPNNTEIVELDIYKSGIFLGCRFGLVAMYVWGIGVLAAGEGTTMTGCYAGQLAMEGFLHLKWSRWKRVLFTRSIAIVPTFFIAFFNSISDLSGLNDMLNAVMSIQIPFAVLPLVAFTSSPQLMGEFVNCRLNVVFMLLVSAMVIAINVMFVVSSVLTAVITDYWLLSALGLYSLLYFAMCGFLVLHMYANMTESKTALTTAFVKNVDWRNKHVDTWASSKNL